jgi:hypothetical protein
MIECAERYLIQRRAMQGRGQSGTGNLSFAQFDLERPGIIQGGSFDVIVACFSLQDAGGLTGAFDTIKQNLSKDGVCLVVFENDNQYEYSDAEVSPTPLWERARSNIRRFPQRILYGPSAVVDAKDSHSGRRRTTTRRWIDPIKHAGKGHGRRAVIFWGADFARQAQIDRPNWMLGSSTHDVGDYVTVRHHWTKNDDLTHAKLANLTEERNLGEDPITLSEGERNILLSRMGQTDFPILADYVAKPRVSLLALIHRKYD